MSGVVKLMADSQNLYVAADITKSGPAVNDLCGETATAKDCVELFLDLRDLRSVSSVDFNALSSQDTPVASSRAEAGSGYDYHILLNPGDAGHSPQIWFARRESGLGRLEMTPVRGTNGGAAVGGSIQVFNKPDGNGYTIGALIPLKNFGKAALSSGMQMGFDAAIDAAASIKMAYQGGKLLAENPAQWTRAFLYKAEIKVIGGKKAVVRVDADTLRDFSGQDTIVRETFGVQAWGSLSKPMRDVWREDSGCFGRQFFSLDLHYGGFVLPEMEGKTETEKRALIYDPQDLEAGGHGKGLSAVRRIAERSQIAADRPFHGVVWTSMAV